MIAADWNHPKAVALLSKLDRVETSGSNKRALCPAHPDQNPSLSITIDADDWKLLLNCFAGCDTARVLERLGLTWADLRLREMDGNKVVEATYNYVDEHGELLYQKRRYIPKDFRIRKPDGKGGWTKFLGNMRRVLYHLDQLHNESQRIAVTGEKACLIVEGEKDCDNLDALGFIATTNDSGASLTKSKWRDEYTEQLKSAGIRTVVLIPDNDPAGEEHMWSVARALVPEGITVKLVHLPGLDEHGDVSDWIATGGTVEQLLELINQADVLVLSEPAATAEPPAEMAPVTTTEPSDPTVEELQVELCDEDDPWNYLERVRTMEQRHRGQFLEKWLTLVAEKSDLEVDPLLAVAQPVFKVKTQTMLKTIHDIRHENTPDSVREFIKDVVPWGEPVEGATVLDEAADKVREFVTADPEIIDTLVLYTLHTHLFDVFDVAPYLTLTSPTKRCGKSTVQDIASGLVARPFAGGGFTGPVLFRSIDEFKPTLICDEADSLFELSPDMKMVINMGHRRGSSYVPRLVGDDFDVHPFSVFGPKILALIVDGSNLPDTVEDRSIIVPMRRRLKGEVVRRWRYKYIDTEIKSFGQKFARWAQDNVTALREAPEPELPVELEDNSRAEDNWTPLLMIADQIGGDWPKRARAAAIKLSGVVQHRHESDGIQLLADVRSLFNSKGADKLASSAIVASLTAMAERPWGTWKKQKDGLTQNNLADLLREFKTRDSLPVQSKVVRIGTSTPRGYVREDFEDAWSRYLSPSATEAA